MKHYRGASVTLLTVRTATQTQRYLLTYVLILFVSSYVQGRPLSALLTALLLSSLPSFTLVNSYLVTPAIGYTSLPHRAAHMYRDVSVQGTR